MNITWIMTDAETDGPCPGLYSMTSFGAVVVEPKLDHTFYGKCRPISDNWVPEALSVSGFSRDECMNFLMPEETMKDFYSWVSMFPNPRFISDNNGFDWQFFNYYFHKFCGTNPFGHSSTNLGSLYKGFVKDMRKNFKHLRKTKHTHHPVDDAKGNAEALLSMIEMGFKIK